MKKFAGVLLLTVCLLTLLCGTALAKTLADYDKVKADRLFFNVPDGIVMAEGYPKYEDGKISVKIDVEKSDWVKVMLYGGYPKLHFSAGAKRPSADYETNISFNGGILYVDQDEDQGVSYMIDYLENDLEIAPGLWEKNHTSAENGIEAGQITPDAGVLEPRSQRDDGQFICWLDKDNPSKRYYEWYTFDLEFTQNDPFNVPFKWLSAQTMAPTWNASISNAKVAQIRNGSITYALTDTEHRDLPLVLNVPAGAKKLEIVNDGFGKEEINISGSQVEWVRGCAGNDFVIADTLMFIFVNSNGDIVDYGALMYNAEADKSLLLPWPSYEKDRGWNAPEEGRVRITNNSEELGIDVTYNEATGLIYIDYDQDAQMTGELGNVKVEIKKPKYNNKYLSYYRYNGGGGNNIFGEDETNAPKQEYIVSNAKLQTATGDYITLIDKAPLSTVQVGPATIYKQTGEIWPYGGGVQVIFWYESATQDPAKPTLIEYLCDTNGTMTAIERMPVVEEVTEPVKQVTCVGKYHDKGWNLVIERYPQKGGDTFLYELHLENDRGEQVDPNEPMTVYMPYPKNHNSNHEYIYQLMHYEDDYSNYELVEVEETEFGLKFVIGSFSPFVLDWSGWQDENGNNGGNNGDDNGNGGGDNPSQQYTFKRVDVRPNAKLQMTGGRYGTVMLPLSVDASIKNVRLECIAVMPTAEWKTGMDYGIRLTKNTLVDALVLDDIQLMANLMNREDCQIEHIVFFEDKALVNELHIYGNGNYKYFDPAWIENANIRKVRVDKVSGEQVTLSYAEFLSILESGQEI